MNNNYYQRDINNDENFTRENEYKLNSNKIYKNNRNDINLVDIFNMNKGKIAKLYMTFYNSKSTEDIVFSGIIESAGYDHVIISDPKTGKWTMLLLMYLDYVEFEENINY